MGARACRGYAGRRVAVTGAGGFIGSRLVERLVLEEGAQVRAGVRRWQTATRVSRTAAALLHADVLAPDSLGSLVEGCEIVFHCAMAGDKARAHAVNVDGTRNLLEACARARVRRVVHFSTVGVHGPTLAEGLDEQAPFRSVGNAYADAKIESERVLRGVCEAHALEGVVLRPTFVWGPDSAAFTLRPVTQMRDGTFRLVDGGAGACNAVHVDNVVDLALLAGVHPAAPGEAFLMRDAECESWGAFFERYAQMLGRSLAGVPSVASAPTFERALHAWLTGGLDPPRRWLAERIANAGPAHPQWVKWGLRAPRALLSRARDRVDRLLPQRFSAWDLAKFSSPGFLRIDHGEKLLGHVPRVSRDDGMRECEAWLRDQNHLPLPEALGVRV